MDVKGAFDYVDGRKLVRKITTLGLDQDLVR